MTRSYNKLWKLLIDKNFSLIFMRLTQIKSLTFLTIPVSQMVR